MREAICQTSRSRGGFTLIELLIVIAIVGILSAVAIPRYANATNNYRVSAIARQIAADITMTRNRARAQSTSQSITFFVGQNYYQISAMADPDHAGATYTVSLSSQATPGQLVSANFGGASTLTFNGYGVPASSGSIQVSSGTASASITVDGDLGKCTIQ